MAKKQLPRGGTAELSRLLGITQRRVQQLTETKVITRQPEGDFLLPEAIAEFYGFKYKTDESVDYMAEKALHEKAKRELAEMEVRKRQRELFEANTIKSVMTDMLVNFRTQFLGLPDKMSPQLANRSAAEINALLNQEITAELLEVKDYTADLFAEEEDGPEKND